MKLRHALCLLAAVLTTSAQAETVIQGFDRLLTPEQKQIAMTAMLQYRMHFYRTDNGEILSPLEPDGPLAVDVIRRCDSQVIYDLRDGRVKTSADAARDKLSCATRLLKPYGIRVTLTPSF